MEQIPTVIPQFILDKMDEELRKYKGYGQKQIAEKAMKDGYRLACALCEGKEKEIAELKNNLINYRETVFNEWTEQETLKQRISELEAENERLQEQYGIMDGRRERAIKSLEESEKQFEQLQEAYNKLIGS